MFILFLTTVPPPYAFTDFRDNNRAYNGTCPNYRDEMPENGHSFLHNSVWITNIFAYITAILAAGRLLLEFFQFMRKPAEYRVRNLKCYLPKFVKAISQLLIDFQSTDFGS